MLLNMQYACLGHHSLMSLAGQVLQNLDKLQDLLDVMHCLIVTTLLEQSTAVVTSVQGRPAAGTWQQQQQQL
jgi:hypothetical protein